MSITTGSYTIGVSGTYAGISNFLNDVTTLTGDLEGVLTSDITDTGHYAGGFALAGHKLTVRSNCPPSGNPISGWAVSVPYTADNWLKMTPTSSSAGGILEFKDIRFVKTTGRSDRYFMGFYHANSNLDVYVHDCVFDANNYLWSNIYCEKATNNMALKIWNNVMTGGSTPASGTTWWTNAIRLRFNSPYIYIENNTIEGYNWGLGLEITGNLPIIKNNAVFNCSLGSYCMGWNPGSGGIFTDAISSGNASFDNYGDDGFRNIDEETNFYSTIAASGDLFYKPRPDTTIADSGVPVTWPTLNDSGANGTTRPHTK